MCLAIPGEVLDVDGDEAVADFWGVEKAVRLDLVGRDVREGDYVLNHAGFAIRKIPESEAKATKELYEGLLGDDEDVLEELGATGSRGARASRLGLRTDGSDDA